MIIALSGPSGIGKGYLKNGFKTKYPTAREIVWITTRPLRKDEIGITNRKQVTQNDFKQMDLVLKQENFGNLYGVKRTDLTQTNGLWLTELHPDNVKKALLINPAIFTVGLFTKDINLLEERLSQRRRSETANEIRRRIATATKEIDTILTNRNQFQMLFEINRQNEHEILNMFLNAIEKVFDK